MAALVAPLRPAKTRKLSGIAGGRGRNIELFRDPTESDEDLYEWVPLTKARGLITEWRTQSSGALVAFLHLLAIRAGPRLQSEAMRACWRTRPEHPDDSVSRYAYHASVRCS